MASDKSWNKIFSDYDIEDYSSIRLVKSGRYRIITN